MSKSGEEVTFESFGGLLMHLVDRFTHADFQQTLDQMIPVLETAESESFKAEQTPGGEAWPELSAATFFAKGHDIILVDSGDLRESLTTSTAVSIREVSSRELIFGTSVPYAIYHQEGTDHIPQREHTGMNDETCQTIVDAVADAAVEALTK